MNAQTAIAEMFAAPEKVFLTADDIAACKEVEGSTTPFVREIVAAVARESNIPETAIYSINRAPAVARARQIVMYVAAREGVAAAMIGRILGRDHTTVMHGIRAEKARRGEL